jgi:hypothetical protein
LLKRSQPVTPKLRQKTDCLLSGEFLVAPVDRAADKLARPSCPSMFNLKQTV